MKGLEFARCWHRGGEVGGDDYGEEISEEEHNVADLKEEEDQILGLTWQYLKYKASPLDLTTLLQAWADG